MWPGYKLVLHECQQWVLFQLGHQGRLLGGGGIVGDAREVMPSELKVE